MSQTTLKRQTLKELSSGYNTIYLKIEKTNGGIGALFNLFGEVKANYESREGNTIFATLTCTGQGFIPCRVSNLSYGSNISGNNSSNIKIDRNLSSAMSINSSMATAQRISSASSLNRASRLSASSKLSSSSLTRTANPVSTENFANNPTCIKAVNDIIEYSEQELVNGILTGQKTRQIAVKDDAGVVSGYFSIKGNWNYNDINSPDGIVNITISKVANNPIQILY